MVHCVACGVRTNPRRVEVFISSVFRIRWYRERLEYTIANVVRWKKASIKARLCSVHFEKGHSIKIPSNLQSLDMKTTNLGLCRYYLEIWKTQVDLQKSSAEPAKPSVNDGKKSSAVDSLIVNTMDYMNWSTSALYITINFIINL